MVLTKTKAKSQAKNEAMKMLEDPNLLDKIAEDISALGVAGERKLTKIVYLQGVSRLLDKPLSIIVMGASTSGKSFIPEKVSSLFPDEVKLEATTLSPQSLFYMEEGSIEHKWILSGERSHRHDDAQADATKAIRELISRGVISKEVTVNENGKHVTKRITQKGPIAFIESTTKKNWGIFREDRNRCLLLHTDESQEQTERIINNKALRCTNNHQHSTDAMIKKHWAMHKMIKPYPVVIPYAVKLGELFVMDIEARRRFDQMTSMIKAITLLFQFQRKIEDGHLISEIQDYAIAYDLLSDPFDAMLVASLSRNVQTLFEAIRSRYPDGQFKPAEMDKELKNPESTLYNRLGKLEAVGLVKKPKKKGGWYHVLDEKVLPNPSLL